MDKPTWQEKRRNDKIARIIEDHQVSMDKAIEMYYESFKKTGSLGGKTKGESKRRGDSEYYRKLREKSHD